MATATELLQSQNVLKDIDEWQEMKKEVSSKKRQRDTEVVYDDEDAFNPINKEKKKRRIPQLCR
jgi:hypothetical protein